MSHTQVGLCLKDECLTTCVYLRISCIMEVKLDTRAMSTSGYISRGDLGRAHSPLLVLGNMQLQALNTMHLNQTLPGNYASCGNAS